MLGLVLALGTQAQINTFPYQEDFNTNDGSWTAGGTVTWEHGTPSNTIISNGSGCSGSSDAWVTGLAADYPNSATAYLESPVFDMSGLAIDPLIRFDMIFDNESCCDELWLEMSIDAGTTWTKVGASGTGANWYNDAGNQWWDASTAGWVTAGNQLTGASGQSDVRLRFVFSSDGSVTNEGAGIDNMLIGLTYSDALPTAITAPVTGGGLTATETVTIEITNGGTVPVTNFPVCFAVDGGTPTCETYTGTIAPGATVSYTFTATADLSAYTTYEIAAITNLGSDDFDTCNDTLTASVTNTPVINTYPYFEDFESDNGSLIASGTSTWEYGIPANTFINSAAGCGDHAWVTGLAADYPNSATAYLTFPEFDFSSLTVDPTIAFDYIYENESCCDETWIEYSTDGGTTWARVGASGTGSNWFNDAGNQWWDASTSGWVNAQNTLTGLAGSSAVLIRFVFSSDGSVTNEGFGVDNVFIGESLIDAFPAALAAPMSGCGLSNAETVSVDITNNGTADITSIEVCYNVNGGTAVCETVTTTILPGMTYTHTFSSTEDLSAPGAYDFGVSVNLTGDINICNDSTSYTVNSLPTVSSFPYIEDFEAGQNGWSIGGTTTTWAFGTPANGTINGAASGVNAFATGNLTGNYSNSENGYVESPCFDFTGLCSPQVELDYWADSEFSWDGANLQVSVDGGATWILVGTVADPFNYNWYNDNSIGGNPGGSQEGWTGTGSGYATARHHLDTLGGYTAVKFRVYFGSDGSISQNGFAFDNIKVYDGIYRENSSAIVCPGDSLLLEGFGYEYAGTADSWVWSTGETNDSIYVSTSGTYSLILTTSGCTYNDTVVVEAIDTNAMAALGPDADLCGSDVIGVTASLYTDYAWNTGATTSMITADTSGMYILTASNICATKVDTINVTINPLPIVDLGGDTTVCDYNLPYVLDAGSAISYLWSDNSTSQTLDVNTAGTYIVTVTDAVGCEGTDTVVVTLDPCIGLDETTFSNVLIYPNPTNGMVNIDLKENVEIKNVFIVDLNGKAVYTSEISENMISIDLSAVEAGIYMVILTSDKAYMQQRLVITK